MATSHLVPPNPTQLALHAVSCHSEKQTQGTRISKRPSHSSQASSLTSRA